MGMFSVRGRLSRSTRYRSPIRLHSEYRLTATLRRVRMVPAGLRSVARSATNDARIVALLLVLAAVALAVEMAASFHVL